MPKQNNHLKGIATDDEILAAFKGGGKKMEEVLSQLFSAYEGLLQAGKRRYGLSEDDARDAYTDAFLAMKQQVIKGQFRGQSQISTYFYRIFCNKCADQKRKNQTQGIKQPLDFALKLPQAALDAYQELVQKEDFERLKTLMQKLNQRCRQLLWESEYLGFSAAEMAIRLGLQDAKSVKSQKYRCMERLRKIWRKKA